MVAHTLLFLLGLAALTPTAPASPNTAPKKPQKTLRLPSGKKEKEIAQLLASAPKASDFPNAAKATLLDLGEITVRPDGSARIVTHQAIKVFNALGREQEAEIKIPYNGSTETVQLIRARTIKADGTVLDVKPSEVRTASPSEYDDAKLLSFSMPAVEPGCVIEYEYVTDQKASQRPGQFWSQWYFNGGFDPVQLTRWTVSVPKSLGLKRQLRNSSVEPTVSDSKDGKSIIYVWEQKNVNGLTVEPLMPPAEKLLPKLTISTVPNWQIIADWYTQLAKDRMVAGPEIVSKAKELTKNCKTDEEKARAIFYYVQDKTRYVAIELGISAYQPRPALQTLTNQYGDCKDMATLLVAMLRSVGIKAHPTLLFVGANPTVSDELPAPSVFNHAICLTEINNKKYWLDATAQVCPFGEIPAGDRGAEAFVIRDGKGAFEIIEEATPELARNEQVVKLKLRPDGSAVGTVVLSGNGDYAMALRANLQLLTQDRIKPYLENVLGAIGANPKVIGFEFSDVKDRDKPVQVSVTVEFPTWANLSGDLLLFKARPDQASAAYASPFSEDKRLRPIYQGAPRLLTSHLEVTLPTNTTLLSQPESRSATSVLGQFTRTVTKTENTLSIQMEVRDNRVTVPATDYNRIREYVDKYLKTHNESVVVKKS
jgi:hypothetical protein